jgi:hypothetical protein
MSPEKLLQADQLKIMFVPKGLEQLFLNGASERLNQYTKELGTSLKHFQERVTDHLQLSRHIRSITNYTESLSRSSIMAGIHGTASFVFIISLSDIESLIVLAV